MKAPNCKCFSNSLINITRYHFMLLIAISFVVQSDSRNLLDGNNLVQRRKTQASRDNWKLLWEDDFNNNTLNDTIWTAQEGYGCEFDGLCGWGNDEIQYYTNRSQNIQVQDSILTLFARQETGSDLENLRWHCIRRCKDDPCRYQCAYMNGLSSARIRSSGKFSLRPGYQGYDTIKISTRFRIESGDGLWGAIWMLPESRSADFISGNGRYGRWPASGEIDLVETVNDMTKVQATVHYGAEYPKGKSESSFTGMNGQEWNTLSFVWSKNSMEWYINEKQFHSAKSSSIDKGGWFTESSVISDPGENAPFDADFHILLNLAIGGKMTGYRPLDVVSATLQGPKMMQIDWIRVYGEE